MKNDKNINRIAAKSNERMVAIPCTVQGGRWSDTSYIYDTQTKKWAFVNFEGHVFNGLRDTAVRSDLLQNVIWCSSKKKARDAYYA